MNLPFALPAGHRPVIVPCPKVRSRKLADGTILHGAHNVRYLNLRSDRGLFDIGFALDFRQFAKQTAAEQFTILALQRRLTFSRKLTFPELRDTGKLIFVDSSNDKLVWASIPETVIVTSSFSVLDIHDECMALSEPEALRENIEQALQGCPDANVDEVLHRFLRFTPPHRTDISSALKKLLSLGIVREYIKVDRRRRRAVFNMRMVAATKSGILQGMIRADDLLRRVDGPKVAFSGDLRSAQPPAKRVKATSSGRQRKIKRAEYQSLYCAERDKRKRAEVRIRDLENNGCLTPGQFTILRRIQDDTTVQEAVGDELKMAFATAFADPPTDIPKAETKEKKHRG